MVENVEEEASAAPLVEDATAVVFVREEDAAMIGANGASGPPGALFAAAAFDSLSLRSREVGESSFKADAIRSSFSSKLRNLLVGVVVPDAFCDIIADAASRPSVVQPSWEL